MPDLVTISSSRGTCTSGCLICGKYYQPVSGWLSIIWPEANRLCATNVAIAESYPYETTSGFGIFKHSIADEFRLLLRYQSVPVYGSVVDFRQVNQILFVWIAVLRLFCASGQYRLIKETTSMKKAFLAALSSLMLAGAISAASGLTTDRIAPGEAVLVGGGTSPMSMSASQVAESCDLSSQNK